MKFGLMLPNTGKDYGSPTVLINLAELAEKSGWDGFFIWDHIGGRGKSPIVDSWMCLAAIATVTKTIRIGTMITPLSRRRPWKVAREIITLDHISGGRVILGVGLGDLVNKDFQSFGEVTNPKKRAEMLDESLEIIAGLQSGQEYSYSGKHYQILDTLFQPMPIQTPRIPVWVASHWPFKRPLTRAARWDGVLPRQWSAGAITPEVIREISSYITKNRKSTDAFDIIKYGLTTGEDVAKDRAIVQEYQDAGATWWVDEIFSGRGSLNKIKARIALGPPY